MPELPEVETIARDLRAAVVGRRILEVALLRADVVRFPDPAGFVAGLGGAVVDAVGRRGKYLLLTLGRDPGGGRWGADIGGGVRLPAAAPGADPAELVVHLGMTGHLDVCEAAAGLRPHTHLRCRLEGGLELRFADARRFGRLLLGPHAPLEQAGVLPRLGVEPLAPEFTPAALDTVLRRTRRTVKAALLDQRGVAGLGNIYVDEACFRARVRPQRRCHRLTRADRARLHAAVVAVLEAAVRNRGSSIDDYRDVWDARGSHQEVLLAYGRGGLPCVTCGSPMRRAVVAGRTTAWCHSCQR